MAFIWEDFPEDLLDLVGSIAAAIIGVAILAVILSNASVTVDVLKAAGNAFSQILNAAFARGGGIINIGGGPGGGNVDPGPIGTGG